MKIKCPYCNSTKARVVSEEIWECENGHEYNWVDEMLWCTSLKNKVKKGDEK
jgi:ribosomal protein L37AE/L43A